MSIVAGVEVDAATGRIWPRNRATYPIVEMPDAPKAIDVVLIDRPDVASAGAGEACCRPVSGAIADALFDATGVRLRRAPLTEARVKAALG